MGVSTDGEISYGILFEDGFEFPWDDDKYEGCIEEWWKSVNGYENPHFNPYDEATGNYKAGVSQSDPRIGVYHTHRLEWSEANRLPVTLVNCCSCDCPIYILALPSTTLKAWRGDPKAFDPSQFVVTSEQSQQLTDFCAKYGIETSDEPKWWLSSYWG
jgi:hypothetical protein